MARGEDENTRFILDWGDCHNIRSDRNCCYCVIASDRTRQDKHNGWKDVFLTLKIEYSIEHGMGRRQNKQVSISLGGLPWGWIYVWYDRKCGYLPIAAYKMRQDEHSVWSDAFSPWKLNTSQSMAWWGEKTSVFLLAWGDSHNVWSHWNCGYQLTVSNRTRQDEHNDRFNFSITLKLKSSTDHDVGRIQNKSYSISFGGFP